VGYTVSWAINPNYQLGENLRFRNTEVVHIKAKIKVKLSLHDLGSR
jgi:hypothetical protein